MRRALIALLLATQMSSGCVLFGQCLLEEEWEPQDARFAACITIPIERRAPSRQTPKDLDADPVFNTAGTLAVLGARTLTDYDASHVRSALR
jgi:hypothetical protein